MKTSPPLLLPFTLSLDLVFRSEAEGEEPEEWGKTVLGLLAERAGLGLGLGM